MKSSFYRKKWNSLIRETPDQGSIKRLSRQIAYSFLDFYLKDCRYEEEYIDLLCEMATFSEDPKLTDPGTQALFGIIIESLCDDFEELQTLTYNRVMSQVISYCRSLPDGVELDQGLKNFGIYSSNDILDRINKIRANDNFLSPRGSVVKILLLSRVTIGADVAITSVIIERFAEIFPKAEILLIGDGKLKEIYGGNPRIKIRKVPYSRRGGLLGRLSSWLLVLKIIQQEKDSCRLGKTILVDPDSRLSQLGVLPLISMNDYFFFDSRSDASPNSKMSMPELANSWLNELTGEEGGYCYPSVWIPETYMGCATQFCRGLKENGARQIIVVNFGVGGNPRKRVGRRMEEKLLLTLLQEPDTVVLLDKGFGEEELLNSNSLIDAVEKQGYPALHILFDSENNPLSDKGSVWGFAAKKTGGSIIIGVQSGIGEIAALIANCDEFIGYDSACQHIAAALKLPCLTIFAGSNNMRFIRRWSAYGPENCNIIHVDTLTDPASIDVDDIITRITNVRESRKP